MRTVGRLIRARRTELCLTLRQVAEAVSCAESYLSQIETEARGRPPSVELLERLERALRLDPGALTSVARWQTTPRELRREVIGLRRDRDIVRRMATLLRGRDLDAAYRSGELRRLVEQVDGRASAGDERGVGEEGDGGAEVLAGIPAQVPLINKVVAGYPREFTDLEYPARVADEYVSVPGVNDPDAFAARVVGDSMEPQYREGDIIVFSPSADTPPGSDCFVRFDRDAETTFKRVYFEEAGDGEAWIRLQPLNPAHPARVVDREAVAGLYAAVYVVRPVVGGGRGG